ncbi:MAG: class I SAM-dependent methyltransferase [Candidatus Muirbacterium halophilum]|nr:class I SAM-dependent methyltransferase [Candidatus Muirbacterium halophilum]MCK9474618.1 class I SAM-dependent methyltransferase [Candidatus Muirbacterium halophilum]
MKRCRVCFSDKIEKINNTLSICKECGFTFSNINIPPKKDLKVEENILYIEYYSAKELFHDFSRDRFDIVYAKDYIENVSNPMAHIYDLNRIMKKNSYGIIKINKGNLSGNYFSRKILCDMFIKAGFKVINKNFLSQILSVFKKDIIIKFKK